MSTEKEHRYKGILPNSIDLAVEILECGACNAWFGVDSGALEGDMAIGCPYCYEPLEVNGASEPTTIKSIFEICEIVKESR